MNLFPWEAKIQVKITLSLSRIQTYNSPVAIYEADYIPMCNRASVKREKKNRFQNNTTKLRVLVAFVLLVKSCTELIIDPE